MKTLDEVITGIREEMGLGDPVLADALHYLKEYRDKAHRLDIDIADHRRSFEQLGVEIARYQEAVRNCEQAENKFRKMEDELNDIRREHIEQMKNPPLTWDELKQMFHKPVWLETKTKKGWVIINDFESVTPNSENVNVIHTSHKGAKCSHFQKHLMGKIWQAYRKERE